MKNKHLALIVIASMIVSVITTFSMLNRLSGYEPATFTGYAQNVEGNVSLIISNQVSITLNNDNIIDFGTGYINTSCTFVGTNNYANLTAADTTYDTSDCWTGTEQHTNGFVVENNGNLNASVSVRGPTNATFFKSYAGTYQYGIQIRGRVNETGACPNGNLNTTWSDLSDNRTICADLLWDTDSTDDIGVDVNLRVPRDLGAGQYNASIVEFYAVQS